MSTPIIQHFTYGLYTRRDLDLLFFETDNHCSWWSVVSGVLGKDLSGGGFGGEFGSGFGGSLGT